MSHSKKALPTWEDIIFENRNKAYGAYHLRVTYHNRMAKSFLFTLCGIVGLFLLPLAINSFLSGGGNRQVQPMKDPIIFSDGFMVDVPLSKIQPLGQISETKQEPSRDDRIFKPVIDPPVTVAVPGIAGQATGQSNVSTLIAEPLAGTGQAAGPDVLPEPTAALNYAAVEEKPDFPGGIDKFYDYLRKQLKFTPAAREAGLSGRFFVSFIIDENGAISDIELLNSIGYGQDEEVARVLVRSPAWKPGVFQSKPVRTQMVLPLSFNLLQ